MTFSFNHTFLVAKNEVKRFVVSRSTYIIAAIFLLVLGYFFFSILGSFNARINEMATLPFDHPQRQLVNLNQTVIEPYLNSIVVTLLFLTPILTMRSFAAEKQLGTYEMLLTTPLANSSMVVGKFLGISAVAIFLLAGAFSFPVFLSIAANPERLPVLVGALGCFLAVECFVAIAVFCSSLSGNQLVSATLSMLVLVFLYSVNIPKEHVGSLHETFVSSISPVWHLRPFISGVVTLEGLVYFSGFAVLSLYLTCQAVSIERWRQA